MKSVVIGDRSCSQADDAFEEPQLTERSDESTEEMRQGLFERATFSESPRATSAAVVSAPPSLTDEQRARIARNKAAALERQRARLQGL